MMLDTKIEQRWPLVACEKRDQGSFLILRAFASLPRLAVIYIKTPRHRREFSYWKFRGFLYEFLLILGLVWKIAVWPKARNYFAEQADFSQEYRPYFKKKRRDYAEKDPLFGHPEGRLSFFKQALIIDKNLERLTALTYQWGRGPMGVNESDYSSE